VRAFIEMAADKLDNAAEGLQDDTPEEDYKELCEFAAGFRNALLNTAAKATPELKGELSAGLASAWDLRGNKPGPELSLATLQAGLRGLLAGPLKVPTLSVRYI
jgi:hypothetical protein